MTDAPLPRDVIDVGRGFVNLRGSFKIAGVIDIGTHASLVERAGSGYLLLDACALTPAAQAFLDEKTNGGEKIEAVLHLHPFHTVHVKAAHARYPKAKLYGTSRHVERAPDLPWEAERTDSEALHARFADDLDFSVPRGVDFVSPNPKLHFSSVLAFHRASRTLHVDDTLFFFRSPWILRPFLGDGLLRFHPTLRDVLERRAGAASDFRAWAAELVTRAKDVENLCAAHTGVLLARQNQGASIAERIEAALRRVEGTLAAHEEAHGRAPAARP